MYVAPGQGQNDISYYFSGSKFFINIDILSIWSFAANFSHYKMTNSFPLSNV